MLATGLNRDISWGSALSDIYLVAPDKGLCLYLSSVYYLHCLAQGTAVEVAPENNITTRALQSSTVSNGTLLSARLG